MYLSPFRSYGGEKIEAVDTFATASTWEKPDNILVTPPGKDFLTYEAKSS